MAYGDWWRRTWTWLEPWLEHFVWMHPEAAGAYLGWRLTHRTTRVRHVEVLQVA